MEALLTLAEELIPAETPLLAAADLEHEVRVAHLVAVAGPVVVAHTGEAVTVAQEVHLLLVAWGMDSEAVAVVVMDRVRQEEMAVSGSGHENQDLLQHE